MLFFVDDITVQFGEGRAFEHTTWRVEKGQKWAILGPNGSGKSTLMKAISHRLNLVHGRILYFFDDSESVNGQAYLNSTDILIYSSETHQEFIRQFADYSQARWQSFEGEGNPSVADLLSAQSVLVISPFQTISAEQNAVFLKQREAIIAQFGFESLLNRKIQQLSHGESRKVFLARLLLRSPKLLILDDPLTGLDQATRFYFQLEIERLQQNQDPPILLVTSRVDDLTQSVTHILVVKENRLAWCGERELAERDPDILPAPSGALSLKNMQGISAALMGMVEQYAQALRKDVILGGQPDFIHMQNVSVTYPEGKVLKNVNWIVRRGERWALLGPNGAGKSTLLSLILADHPQAYANHITLFGLKRGSGESIWEIKQQIGWVSPELHIFYPKSASTLEVVCSGFFDSVGLYKLPTSEQVSISKGWLSAFQLASFSDEPFHTLSTGQQRMILLVRALAKNPPLLILDEPCQGLDDEHRRWFIHLVDQLCSLAPITLIYVSHYLDEIPACITHRLRLNLGEVVENSRLNL